MSIEKNEIKYMVYISEEFFTRNYPLWNSHSIEEKRYIRHSYVRMIYECLKIKFPPVLPEGITIETINQNSKDQKTLKSNI
jgi:hypothetical protein